jgi:hypothetical protein
LHGNVDLVCRVLEQSLFFLFIPDTEIGQVLSDANQWFDCPGSLYILFLAVTARVIRRGVIT